MDLASLSFSIDSSQAVKAKDDLDKLRGSSVDTTDQALRLTRAFLDGKDPLAAYRAELALMDTSMRNVGAGIDALVDRVRVMGAGFSGALGPTKEFSQAMGQLQAAAAMFDTSTRALEQFVRTTRDFGVSSQEMQRGLERIQAALQGIGAEGQRARDILRNYGVNLSGRGPNDAAAVYREFVESARNYRMDVNTYDDYRAVVGNLSIQSFAGLRDPEFRTTAQRQREMDASQQAGQVAALREQAFTIGRGTNRWQNELSDLEAEYGGTLRDRSLNILTFGLRGALQSPAGRRAELERRRDSGTLGETEYYRNRAPENEGFDSAYLQDLRTSLGQVGAYIPQAIERTRLAREWTQSPVFAGNRELIDSMYRDERAREGWWQSFNPFGDNAMTRRAERSMLNNLRQFEAPPIPEGSALDRFNTYRADTATLTRLRAEATDPEATVRRRLYMDALQSAGRNVPDADRMPIAELERQFTAPELEIVRNRRSALDARTVDQMLGVGPSVTAPGGREPFAMARRRDGLARFGYSLDGVDVGAPGSENATWEREAERSRQIAQIVADAEAKALEPLKQKELIKGRIAELDRQEAQRAADAASQADRESQQAQNLLNFINQSQSITADPAAFGGQIRGFMANQQAQDQEGERQILLQRQASQLQGNVGGGLTRRSAALGRAAELRGLLEGGASQYDAEREMAIRDELRGMREIAGQLDEQGGKRAKLLEIIKDTEEALRRMRDAERAEFLANESTTLGQGTARLTADRARLAGLQNDPQTRRREDRIIAEAKARDPDLRDRSDQFILNTLRADGGGRFRDYAGFSDQRFGLESDRRFSDYLEQSRIAVGNSFQYRAYLRGGSQAAVPPEGLAGYFEEASRQTGIPIEILQAVARQESNFNPYAIGRSGEVGVMQIMPSTARSPGFGMRGISPDSLMDPRANIMFGAQYLRARAGANVDWSNPDDLAAALRRYNGGGDPNYAQNVARWIGQPLPGRQNVEEASLNASLDASLAEFRRNNPANPAREREFMDVEVMRRASEALDRLATNAARAGDQLSQLEEQARMTPGERAEAQALQAIEPDLRNLRALRDRATDPAAQAQIDADIATAQQGARDNARRRLGVNFIAEERGINNQLTDAEFMADSWWMSGERRQREFAQQREARRMREEFRMDENSPGWNERLSQVGRIAEYNEIARQNQMIRDSFLQIGNAAGTALDQIILKGGNARQVMAALLSSMASNFVRLGFNQMFSQGMDGAGAFIRTLLSGGVSGGANTAATNAALSAGAMDSSGALLPFAQGGALIRSPTYFPMANGGTALAGEAGQEAIFPLARDSRGRLGLVGGGGGGTNITVNITTQGSSGNAASDAKAAEQMGRLVRAELEKMMADKMRDQMRPGGMFNGGGQPVYS